ncbi:hypothetical protein NB311A_16979 [Nitrobacter sp. Nb-311A]|nr:hypothetical protein NB311A_16979 [Nitrobacter sp. Nb-311A]
MVRQIENDIEATETAATTPKPVLTKMTVPRLEPFDEKTSWAAINPSRL